MKLAVGASVHQRTFLAMKLVIGASVRTHMQSTVAVAATASSVVY